MPTTRCVWGRCSYNNEQAGILIYNYNSLPFRQQNYAFIMNNIDKSNPNVPENDKNWIEIVVMAIIYTYIYSG